MIVANWKSNKTQKEAIEWMEFLKPMLSETKNAIVVCPSFPQLSVLSQKIVVENIAGVSLGAQNISPFGQGAYTGEVNGEQIKEFAKYVIIGHSERRNLFKEDDDMLTKKVLRAKECGLEPIFCIQGKNTFIPSGVRVVAYEPISAIGSGYADSPEDANDVAQIVREKLKDGIILYGGSVTAENVSSFTKMSDLQGVLVGGASLHASEFSQIISHA